jgi:D-alanyl-D-alanine carboxypeptidase/D-alanyl-D-alanine-endopeptidase (penicillin-binding protein 4)
MRRFSGILAVWVGILGTGVLTAQGGAGDRALRGFLAVHMPAGGDVEILDALNADQLFVPASVLKMMTVAAVLEHLGPEYRWRTRLQSEQRIVNGTLGGNLVIVPGGDPTWGTAVYDRGADEPIRALVAQLAGAGLTRIRGDLVVAAGRFPGRLHPIGRSLGELPYRFGTPPAGLALDEATMTVRVAPGREVGHPADVRAPDGVVIINHTTTTGRTRHGRGTLDFLPVWGTQTLLLRGEYPISEASFVVAASDPSPDLRVAQRLREALADAGVHVDGTVRRVVSSEPAGGDVLAEFRSETLDVLLPRVLSRSHNWYADMLALTLGLEVAGSGRFDDGVEVVSDFVSEVAAADAPDAAVSLRDGSGLSAANLVTPATVVQVLQYILDQPWRNTLVEALARPGTGTLGAWPQLPPMAAKTGTLRHTVALAGIIEPTSPAPIVFCYFVNHHPGQVAAARREIAAAVRRWRTKTLQ